MNVRRRISTAALAGTTALGLVTLSACSGTSSAGEDEGGGRLDVVASFYPMQYLAEQIGGDHVEVTTLTRPGVEPHDLELQPRQASELRRADYILYLKGVQPAVDEAIAQSGVEHVVDAATLTKLENHGTDVGHDHGHEGEEHADEEHAGEEHAGEEHDADHAGEDGAGEEHGTEAGGDPHIWLDPVKYAEVARGVGDSLAKADPDRAADYRKNTEALVGKLKALDTEFADGLRNTTTRTFITAHSAFGYLAERYGLDQHGIAGIGPESEPSPARIKELQSVAEQEKVTTVFFETLASDRTAKALAQDTGMRTDVLDPLEGITDKSRGDDYIAVMETNLAALQKALGAK
ncbi:zinc ABC transporter substrate-binding protein [Streptomyces spongiicola]|uniref:Zinc ABC transporter substrate-binding protein n=1 Tax=Streptomyces spongiicola TaxID=1690221 RepID=A0A2S1YWV8_9ACTN|nr:metal ABC transporter substrate-binding protein [Streptomyces spongiicola]AWK08581.1 zinc ABC transporter substrate-binding protein [Streptomyces spongiicola]GBQ00142.1 zinc ABC transporter substrate-binding protein [Streptomyces spongiicola]